MNTCIEQLSQTRVYAEELTAFCLEAMRRCGMREEDARVTADVLVTTDAWGIFSHGSKQLRPLLQLRLDRVDLKAAPEVVAEGPSWAIIDGHYAMAPVTSCKAMKVAIAKAKTAGCSYVGVRNSNHFGIAGYYAMMALEHDMIGISLTNSQPLIAPTYGNGRILGTNPIAVAVPAGEEKPYVLDMATSVVPMGKISFYQEKEEAEETQEQTVIQEETTIEAEEVLVEIEEALEEAFQEEITTEKEEMLK